MGVKRTRICAHLGLWVTKPKPLEGLVSSSKPPDRQGQSLKWELRSCPAAFPCQGICSWGTWAWHLQSNETIIIMMINRPSLFFYTLESSVACYPANFCSSASRWLLFKCTFQAPHQRTWPDEPRNVHFDKLPKCFQSLGSVSLGHALRNSALITFKD